MLLGSEDHQKEAVSDAGGEKMGLAKRLSNKFEVGQDLPNFNMIQDPEEPIH